MILFVAAPLDEDLRHIVRLDVEMWEDLHAFAVVTGRARLLGGPLSPLPGSEWGQTRRDRPKRLLHCGTVLHAEGILSDGRAETTEEILDCLSG